MFPKSRTKPSGGVDSEPTIINLRQQISETAGNPAKRPLSCALPSNGAQRLLSLAVIPSPFLRLQKRRSQQTQALSLPEVDAAR